jgi:uncharacterized protein YndB with AHSA1/START domain
MAATRIARHLEASRPRVFAALLEQDAIASWRMPPGMTIEIHHLEPVEGGQFRVSLTYQGATGQGKTSAGTDTYHGRYLRIVPDEEIVEVLEFESDDPGLQGEMVIGYRLADAGAGTELTVVHDPLPPALSPELNELGWNESLDRLEQYLDGGGASA